MFRCSVILAMVAALLIGSIGLPVALYSCEMMKVKQAVVPPCVGCCSRMPIVRHGGERDRRGAMDHPPCCSGQRKILRAATIALPWSGDPLPRLMLASFAPVIPMSDHVAMDAGSKFRMDHPPPLASHAQDAHLFNSTFLI